MSKAIKKKKMKNVFIRIVFSLAFATVASCNGINKQSGCDSAIGHWEIIKRKPEELKEFTITKEGENYIFQGIGHDGYLGSDYKTALSCENNKLVIKGVPMIGSLEFTVIDNGQSLLYNGGTFKKISNSVEASYDSARLHCTYATTLYNNIYQKTKEPVQKTLLIDSMEYHINRSLEINPNYSSALAMKAAVVAARFEQDHQLDKLFHEFEDILEKIPYNTNFREFLDKYMKYLSGSNTTKYLAFCHRIGYELFYQKLKDPKTALHFLQFGLDRQTEDTRILEDMSEVYQAMGDSAKAAEMKFRANAQK